ncbi:SCY1-like protein 2 isoform X1 [Rhopalosiphum padi]|uniref:SCY1-like protein 2 isoform X1 n=1 Tax=Rhopalosiphum padi TaxID=40932 RepID=UPI00298D6A8E|nr:SCY1-like protein 2 isoform X1 [Rhopalosiphum padi]
MDVLNKFRSTVTSTMSQLSTVLPGNPVTREYEATTHIASAGVGLLWKIYSGYKKSTQQSASIFVLEKRQLDKWSRTEREHIIEVVKKGVAQLARLKHPQVLTVQHTLEESRESLAFATEPVFCSLANVLGKLENTPQPLSKSLQDYNLFDIDIKYGLMQLGQGLAFLHNDAKLLHHNLCPENVVINEQGAWKIFGFDFCSQSINPVDPNPTWPSWEYKVDVHPWAQPTLDYLAPESGCDHIQIKANDMYSLGVLIFAIYNKGNAPLQSNHEWSTYKRNLQEMKYNTPKISTVDAALRDPVRLLLSFRPEDRPDEHEFLKIEYFNDVGVKTLNYLDSLFQWDNLQKSQFYKGLPQIMEKLPHRICLKRILPCLVKDCVNPVMIPFVLPNIFYVCENCTKDEFVNHILPCLKPIMKVHEPVQVPFIFLQKMELLLKLAPLEDLKSDILPMLYKTLELDSKPVQETCLSVIPSLATLVEGPSMKNALLPRIKRLCLSTSDLSVRVKCLVCIGKLIEYLDRWLVLDDIIPFLPQIPSKDPAVIMGILGVYRIILSHKKMYITKETMALSILPFLIPMCIENTLTLNQFNVLISIVKEMINSVETEHRAKLQQLNEQHRSISNSLTLENGTTTKSNGLTNEFQFESYVEKPSMQIPGSNEITNNLSFNYEKSKTKQSQDTSFRTFQQDFTLTPSVEKSTKNNPVPKDLTSSLIDSNINQISWSNQMKPTTSSLSQSKSMGFENKSISPQGRLSGFENNSVNPQTKPMSLHNSANNWNDLWIKQEESQPQVKQLSISDINDLLS